jgi:hypothetical protein
LRFGCGGFAPNGEGNHDPSVVAEDLKLVCPAVFAQDICGGDAIDVAVENEAVEEEVGGGDGGENADGNEDGGRKREASWRGLAGGVALG